MKGLPPEAKAGIAVSLKLLALSAAVVGVEYEAALVIPFHQHLHALADFSIDMCCNDDGCTAIEQGNTLWYNAHG